jgi:hypothetical protein
MPSANPRIVVPTAARRFGPTPSAGQGSPRVGRHIVRGTRLEESAATHHALHAGQVISVVDWRAPQFSRPWRQFVRGASGLLAGQLSGRGAVAHHVDCKSIPPIDEGTASTVAGAPSTDCRSIAVVLASPSLARPGRHDWASYGQSIT